SPPPCPLCLLPLLFRALPRAFPDTFAARRTPFPFPGRRRRLGLLAALVLLPGLLLALVLFPPVPPGAGVVPIVPVKHLGGRRPWRQRNRQRTAGRRDDGDPPGRGDAQQVLHGRPLVEVLLLVGEVDPPEAQVRAALHDGQGDHVRNRAGKAPSKLLDRPRQRVRDAGRDVPEALLHVDGTPEPAQKPPVLGVAHLGPPVPSQGFQLGNRMHLKPAVVAGHRPFGPPERPDFPRTIREGRCRGRRPPADDGQLGPFPRRSRHLRHRFVPSFPPVPPRPQGPAGPKRRPPGQPGEPSAPGRALFRRQPSLRSGHPNL